MRWSLVILAVTVIAFAVQMAVPGFEDAFILNSGEVLARPWTLITAVFLHADITHLFYNMLALVMFGLMLEGIIGSRRFLAIFFVGGLVSSVVGTFFYPAMLGASGAVFAVMGTLAALRPRWIVWVSGIPMPLAIAAAVWVAVDLIGLFAPSGIANTAHIAGLLFGVAVGIAMRTSFAQPPTRRRGRALSDKDIEEWERVHFQH